MPRIDDFQSGYTIEDLQAKWKRGWRVLAEFAKPLYGGELGGSADKRRPAIDRLLCILEEALSPCDLGGQLGITWEFPDHYEILNLVASSRARPYAPVERRIPGGPLCVGGTLGNWSAEQAVLRRVLREATTTFAASDTYEKAFDKLASRDNRNRWMEYWLGPRRDTQSLLTRGMTYERNHAAASGEWLSLRIDPRLREIMRWLKKAVEETADCDRVWWECLRVILKPQIDLFLDVQGRIRAGTPIYKEQVEELRKYTSLGRVGLDFVDVDNDGLHAIRMHMTWVVREPGIRGPLAAMSEILLTQPAFALATELHEFYRRPTYVRRCHAPSCGKAFFTQRKEQVVCKSIPGGESTACRREWTNYSRFLRNLGKDPLSAWNDRRLMDQWLKRTQ
jgi:hypothetical protein